MKKIFGFLIIGVLLQSCISNGNNCPAPATINAQEVFVKVQFPRHSTTSTAAIFKITLPDGHSYLLLTQYSDGSGSKSLCPDPECSKCKQK